MEQNRLIELERAIITVESSQSIQQIANLEERVAMLRRDVDVAEDRLLLNELYQRLRPHTNWRSIEYSIRGDVRRFLNLKVGESLNPQFVFSSGQRRAAGLAFLLSVYLSRPWSRWNTLVPMIRYSTLMTFVHCIWSKCWQHCDRTIDKLFVRSKTLH
jgi:chromosome segregation protein